jgi:hypothetical protein
MKLKDKPVGQPCSLQDRTGMVKNWNCTLLPWDQEKDNIQTKCRIFICILCGKSVTLQVGENATFKM